MKKKNKRELKYIFLSIKWPLLNPTWPKGTCITSWASIYSLSSKYFIIHTQTHFRTKEKGWSAFAQQENIKASGYIFEILFETATQYKKKVKIYIQWTPQLATNFSTEINIIKSTCAPIFYIIIFLFRKKRRISLAYFFFFHFIL